MKFVSHALSVLCLLSASSTFAAVKVIFDTDMGSDCDDAGALAVLHKLADDGVIEILATIHSSRSDVGENPYAIGCIDAINTYYQRPDLRLAVNKAADVGDPNARFIRSIAENTELYGHDIVSAEGAEDMVDVYVDLLKKHEDVVIISVGHPVALCQLLEAGHRDLIKAKVDRVVAMGLAGIGNHSEGVEDWHFDWNFSQNGMNEQMGFLLNEWPTDFYLSTAGHQIESGDEMTQLYDSSNPVSQAYQIYLKNNPNNNRQSWDQVAVLFAAFGDNEWFDVVSEGSVQTQSTPSAQARWTSSLDNAKHFRVKLQTTKEAIARIIEDYMLQSPGLLNK